MHNTKKIVYGIAALIVLIGLFMWLKPVKAPTQGTEDANGIMTPQAKTFDLTVIAGKITSGPSVITVGQGDRVTIKVTADVSDEFHLHGYDIASDLVAGKQGGITFTANATGRFTFELEKSKTELGTLEVLPRQ